jgi:hypothetical protein
MAFGFELARRDFDPSLGGPAFGPGPGLFRRKTAKHIAAGAVTKRTSKPDLFDAAELTCRTLERTLFAWRITITTILVDGPIRELTARAPAKVHRLCQRLPNPALPLLPKIWVVALQIERVMHGSPSQCFCVGIIGLDARLLRGA